jgi:hypothetical protein
VRTQVGLFEGSPLGKIELYGPDAASFLDLMYVGTMSTLAIGQARYGLLLREDGVIFDDGIVARLGEQHFWVNTTSGGAERVALAFEEWLQCEYVQSPRAGHAGHVGLGQRHRGRAAGLGAAAGRGLRCRAGPERDEAHDAARDDASAAWRCA